MKRIVYIFMFVFLFAYTVSSAIAQTFNDVPANAWYFDYVEQLADDGVIDITQNYRPDDSLKRAELIKMVIIAIDGIPGYSDPVIPTFDDVAAGAWYYDYVESAVQLGIVTGYSDVHGNYLGIFGPADTVNRAAAMKIIVNAFAVPTDIDPPSAFPDVTEEDWYYDYVVSAYNQNVVDGYQDGTFGPADPITRAQAAKLIAIAMNPPREYEESEQVEEPADVGAGDLPPQEEGDETEEPVEESGIPATPNSDLIEAINLPDETNQAFLASYNFRGLYEGFNIKTLTIVNDITGNNFGDDAVSSPAIKSISIKYPDKNGFLKTSTSTLNSDGSIRFSGLDFFAKEGADSFLEIYADINPMSDVGESLSGQVIRLGLQNVNNDITTFKAIGDISSTSLTFGSGMLTSSSQPPQYFIIRKSVPAFEIKETDSNLLNGENTLMAFNISAHENGPVSLGRIVFRLSVSDQANNNLILDDFKLFRGSTLLDDEVNIYDATGGSDITGAGGGNIANGVSEVIVSFNEEETITGGDKETYYLKANIRNAEDNDSVSTNIGKDDQYVSFTGLTANTNPNTGRIYKNGDATDGIFTNANDFTQTVGTNRNIIWSDKSADLHFYPEIIAGAVTDGSGSYDWTNGYLIDVSNLPTVTIFN